MALEGVLVGVLLLLRGATSIRTGCLQGSSLQPPNFGFNVSVECLENGLHINWQKQSGIYQAEVNYECRDSDGNVVAENPRRNKFETADNNGTIQTNPSLYHEVITNGGDCLVYGCHWMVDGLDGLFEIHRQTCSYIEPAVWTSSRISPTSTLPLDIPIMPTESSFELPLSLVTVHSATTSSTVTPSIKPVVSPSTDENLVILASITTSMFSSTVTPPSTSDENLALLTSVSTPQPSRNGFNAKAIIIVVVTVSSILISAILLVGIVITCSKRKVSEHPRLKNITTLDMESEKIDPYYAPIRVESYISKCESMSSILDHLSSPRNEPMNFTLPINIEAQKAITKCSYILQPPPCQPASDRSRTDISDFSDSISDYQSSIASTPLNEAPTNNTDLGIDQSLCSIFLAHNPQHISNPLFDQKQCSVCDSSDADTQSMESCQGIRTEFPSFYDLDKSKPTNEESFQDQHIVLTFSSTLNCNNDDELESDTHSEDLEDSLTNTNLSINPHHFDPI